MIEGKTFSFILYSQIMNMGGSSKLSNWNGEFLVPAEQPMFHYECDLLFFAVITQLVLIKLFKIQLDREIK